MSVDELIGRQLDEYRLEELLGTGGMARVYRALDVGLKRHAAVKVIDTPFQKDQEYLHRFELEAQAIAQLDHPHIVDIYRYGRDEGLLYIAMKFVEGASLESILNGYKQESSEMPPAEKVRVLAEIGAALDYAHGKGVIHRDVKPANIMVDAAGRAYLTDFGLALLTEVGTRGEIFGTPQYIAPEQAISSAGAVPQSDLYALGVILYRMMTGALPFEHDNVLEIAMLHITEPPPSPRQHRPEISAAVEAVMLRALAKEPEERFQTGAELARAFREAVQQEEAPNSGASLSIVDRVALDRNRLPPLPASTPPPPAQVETRQPALASTAPPETAVTPTSATLTIPIAPKWLGAGLVAVLLLALLSMFLLRDRAEATVSISGTATGTATAASPAFSVTESPTVGSSPTKLASGTAVAPPPTATAAAVATAVTPVTAVTPESPAASYFPIVRRSQIAETAVPVLPEAPPRTYNLLLHREKDSLYIINQGDLPVPLDGLNLVLKKGEQAFSDWARATLPPATCFVMAKGERQIRRELDDVPCVQLLDEPLIFDWKDEFSLLYNGETVVECHLKGKENSCAASFSSP